MKEVKLQGWIPYKLIKDDDELCCHWLNTYSAPFSEPFFEETIFKCKSFNKQRHKFSSVSSLEMVKAWSRDLNDIEPSAIIFHISRCGSTLVSQLLAIPEENIVLSEVPFFDEILRLPFREQVFKEAEIDGLLRAAMKYYGQRKTAGEHRVFIKADSWHVFFYEQLRRLYPLAPFVLLYRRPEEVFSSHRKVRGMHTIPQLIEPQLFGFKPEEIGYDLDVYHANVLTSYLNKYLEIAASDANCMLLNYNEGIMPMMKKIARFTKTPVSEQDLFSMMKRSLYHSKNPDEQFYEDSIAQVPSCLDEAIELYRLLDKKRIAGSFREGVDVAAEI